MSSVFETEVYTARRRVRWADINVDDFLRELAGESREVKLEVDYRPSVRTRTWYRLSWKDTDGQGYSVDGETLQLCLWRAAIRHLKTEAKQNAGPARDCPECRGTGRDDDSATCNHCGGDGRA